MTETRHILLLEGPGKLPGSFEALGEFRPVHTVVEGLSPSQEDVEDADLIVVTSGALAAEPDLGERLRAESGAPLLLLDEAEGASRVVPAAFDDRARFPEREDLAKRVELLLALCDLWRRMRALETDPADLEAELARYDLDPGLVGPRGLWAPARVSIRDLLDAEVVERQQMSICRLMGTAYGTFLYADEPRGLPDREGGESTPTGALSPYCAYLSSIGDRCRLSEYHAARRALDEGTLVETTCDGGISVFSAPVKLTFHGLTWPLYAASVALGGEAPIPAVAERYGVNAEILDQMATESRFWVLHRDKTDELRGTITNLAETISREVSHKYATAYQLLRGLLDQREIRRSERLLAETNRRLKLKNEEIYEVTHAITHDLRKPLTSLKAGIGVLRKGLLGELPETQYEVVDTAWEATGYMEELVEDILTAARLDAGRGNIELEEVPLAPMLEKVRKRLLFPLEENGIRLELTDLPESLYCDPGAMEKVFMNLIGNSISYIGDGEKRITVSGAVHDGEATIRVEDTGIGIPEDAIDRVLEKFRRGPNTTGIRGTGLGLAIVSGMVAAHGGRIELESRLGEWTRVSFTIPHRPPKREDAIAEPEGAGVGAEGRATRPVWTHSGDPGGR